MKRSLLLAWIFAAAPLHVVAAPHAAMHPRGIPCLPPVVSPWHFATATVAGRRNFVATISVECRSDVSYTISLVSNGLCRMEHDGLSIAYDVFLDPGHRIPVLACGADAGLDRPLAATGPHVFTVYGEAIVSDAQLSAGTYEDSVNVLLRYGATDVL